MPWKIVERLRRRRQLYRERKDRETEEEREERLEHRQCESMWRRCAARTDQQRQAI